MLLKKVQYREGIKFNRVNTDWTNNFLNFCNYVVNCKYSNSHGGCRLKYQIANLCRTIGMDAPDNQFSYIPDQILYVNNVI
jgi:hypothetical protein